MLKRPSAWIPIAMSLVALALVLVYVATGGRREADEGTLAHFFQILIAGQAPLVVYFALRWLPQSPGPGLSVLALQIGAALAACAPVYWFNL